MATVLTEDLARPGHYIVSEAQGYRSREQIIIAAGAGKLKAGAVLAQVTASKKYVAYTPGASDGSQNAKVILYEGCDATSADVSRTVTARDSEVHADVLVWASGVNDSQKTTALTALVAVGIIGR